MTIQTKRKCDYIDIADFLAVENSTLNELRLRRDRRTAYADDSQDCYKAFFVGRTPPTGLGRSGGKYKYICQKLSDDITYFATMFDEGVGIPVYSAYLVEKANALNFKTEDRHLLDETWRQGNCRIITSAGPSAVNKPADL